MDAINTLTFLMFIAVLLVGGSHKIGLSYPIALVIGGSLVGFIPGLTLINFDPRVLLFIILPPILFHASYNISFKEFKHYLPEILSLGFGLVIATTIVVSFIFKKLFPDLPWALAIAFGSIVSPPDAVAVTGILKKFPIGSRLTTILEGESLINDAFALVIYRFSVLALVTGSFSLQEATLQIFYVSLGRILIGLVCVYILNYISFYLDPVLSVVFSFVIPYMTFLLADFFETSGVLAVVTCGLLGARLLVTHFQPLTRVLAWAYWDIFIILLNCFIFILIGLEFHHVVAKISLKQFWTYLGYGFIILISMIAIRFIWIYLRRAYWHWHVRHDPILRKKSKTFMLHALVSSWAGMRGIVSLTTALALPYTFLNGQALPGRDIVIFLTFQIIFFTLVLPGLTLPTLIRWLNIKPSLHREELLIARKNLEKIALHELERLHDFKHLETWEKELLSNYFISRHQIMKFLSISEEHKIERTRHYILQKQREHLMELWLSDEISDSLMSHLERELDIEESHLARGEF